MYFRIFKTEHNNLIFKIEEYYPKVGVYLHVYENGSYIKDFLQSGVNRCKEMAYEEYLVPLNEWVEGEDKEAPQ